MWQQVHLTKQEELDVFRTFMQQIGTAPQPWFEATQGGYKCCMDDITAAIAIINREAKSKIPLVSKLVKEMYLELKLCQTCQLPFRQLCDPLLTPLEKPEGTAPVTHGDSNPVTISA
jgi:hypothetical protein